MALHTPHLLRRSQAVTAEPGACAGPSSPAIKTPAAIRSTRSALPINETGQRHTHSGLGQQYPVQPSKASQFTPPSCLLGGRWRMGALPYASSYPLQDAHGLTRARQGRQGGHGPHCCTLLMHKIGSRCRPHASSLYRKS